MKYHVEGGCTRNYNSPRLSREAFYITLSSQRCGVCARMVHDPAAERAAKIAAGHYHVTLASVPVETLNPDWLATFLRHERNNLHYKPTDDDKPGGAFLRGYATAIDGITARLARELRNVEGFNESRFTALLEGKIQ